MSLPHIEACCATFTWLFPLTGYRGSIQAAIRRVPSLQCIKLWLKKAISRVYWLVRNVLKVAFCVEIRCLQLLILFWISMKLKMTVITLWEFLSLTACRWCKILSTQIVFFLVSMTTIMSIVNNSTTAIIVYVIKLTRVGLSITILLNAAVFKIHSVIVFIFKLIVNVELQRWHT